jgi:hypothetical protein
MIESVVICMSAIAMCATIARTLFCGAKLYYANEKEKRLERFDHTLRLVQAGGDSQLLVGPLIDEFQVRLAEIGEQVVTTRGFGEEVLAECERRGIIAPDRIRYIRS